MKLAVESNKPFNRTAEELGINKNTLHTWIGKYHRAKSAEKPVGEEHLCEELKRLEKENARLREARAILKAAAATFAKSSP